VKVLAARDLPVMDRTSNLTDAFVECKFAGQTFQTRIARKTLDPVWKEDTRFYAADDSDLQNEPLLFRVLDHDVYSAADLIGTVYIGLGPLLQKTVDLTDAPSLPARSISGPARPALDEAEAQLGGWFPIYDTLNGIRGELHVVVKISFYGDENPFKESSAGVRFLATSVVSPGALVVDSVFGFVEELVVENDPEYGWSDNFRTARKSNEFRQGLLYRLSSLVRRQIGKKVLELGGNAVIGYRQTFDIEGDSGLVARGSGTACILSPVGAPQLDLGGGFGPTAAPNAYFHHHRDSDRTDGGKLHPEQDLESQPSLSTQPGGVAADSAEHGDDDQQHQFIRKLPGLDHEVLLLTINVLPINVRVRLGGVVAARSVKFLGRLAAKLADQETRDEWWAELREEIRSHARSLHCAQVVGYQEQCVVHDDVCILQATGTAVVMLDNRAVWSVASESAVLKSAAFPPKGSERVVSISRRASGDTSRGKIISELSIDPQSNFASRELPPPVVADDKMIMVELPIPRKGSLVRQGSSPILEAIGSVPGALPPAAERQPRKQKPILPCSLVHVPYRPDAAPFANMRLVPCGLCRKKWVPEVLLSTIEPPPLLPITGNGVLIEARVCRSRPKASSSSKVENREADASVVSEHLVFLEIELHKQLLLKLKLLGMNAAFSLRSQVHIGTSLIVGVTTATAVHSAALPPPSILRIHRSIAVEDQEDRDLMSLQQKIERVAAANRERIIKLAARDTQAYRAAERKRVERKRLEHRRKRKFEKRQRRKAPRVTARSLSPTHSVTLVDDTVSAEPQPARLDATDETIRQTKSLDNATEHVQNKVGADASDKVDSSNEASTPAASKRQRKPGAGISVLARLTRRRPHEGRATPSPSATPSLKHPLPNSSSEQALLQVRSPSPSGFEPLGPPLSTMDGGGASSAGEGGFGTEPSSAANSEKSVWQRIRGKKAGPSSTASSQDVVLATPRIRHNSDSLLKTMHTGQSIDGDAEGTPNVGSERVPSKAGGRRRDGGGGDSSKIFASFYRPKKSSDGAQSARRAPARSTTPSLSSGVKKTPAIKFMRKLRRTSTMGVKDDILGGTDALGEERDYGGDDEADLDEEQQDKDKQQADLRLEAAIAMSSSESSSEEDQLVSLEQAEELLQELESGKQTFVVEVDDETDEDVMAVILDKQPPQGILVCNTEVLPQSSVDTEPARQEQMVTLMMRKRMDDSRKSRLNTQFSKLFHELYGMLTVKLIPYVPCVVCGVRADITIPSDFEVEVLLTAVIHRVDEPRSGLSDVNSGSLLAEIVRREGLRSEVPVFVPVSIERSILETLQERWSAEAAVQASPTGFAVGSNRSAGMATDMEQDVVGLISARRSKSYYDDLRRQIAEYDSQITEGKSSFLPGESETLSTLAANHDQTDLDLLSHMPPVVEASKMKRTSALLSRLPFAGLKRHLHVPRPSLPGLPFRRHSSVAEPRQQDPSLLAEGSANDSGELETSDALPGDPSTSPRGVVDLRRPSAMSAASDASPSPPSPLSPLSPVVHTELPSQPYSPPLGGVAVDAWKPQVEITPLSFVPNHRVVRYLGRINLHFIRESWAVREGGGLGQFFHMFLHEAQAIARAHVLALQGNVLLSFKLTPRESTGKALKTIYNMISLSGDVAVITPTLVASPFAAGPRTASGLRETVSAPLRLPQEGEEEEEGEENLIGEGASEL
ncbi:C2 domain-containing protein 5 (138 kDa C2 domain-containing phosphoprotein), partial [Durusdinium trenchii]